MQLAFHWSIDTCCYQIPLIFPMKAIFIVALLGHLSPCASDTISVPQTVRFLISNLSLFAINCWCMHGILMHARNIDACTEYWAKIACLCRREQRKQIISAVTSRAGVMPFPIQFLILMLFLLISHFPTLSFSCYSFRICKPSRLWVCFLLPPAYDSLCVTRSRHPQCVSLVLTLCYLFTRLEAGLIWWKLTVQIPNQATNKHILFDLRLQ